MMRALLNLTKSVKCNIKGVWSVQWRILPWSLCTVWLQPPGIIGLNIACSKYHWIQYGENSKTPLIEHVLMYRYHQERKAREGNAPKKGKKKNRKRSKSNWKTYMYKTQWAKTRKKGRANYCFPQKLKSTFFEIFSSGGSPKEIWSEEIFSKNVDFSLCGNHATIQTHIWNWIFFVF